MSDDQDHDDQDQAEQFDGDTLGEDPASDEFPDLHQDGEIGPMSVEDPNVLQGDADVQDDERTRAWRERPDIAGEDDDGEIGAEDAAVHIEPDT